MVIGAEGLGSTPGPVKSNAVANASPLLRRFMGAVLPRHLPTEMGPATRCTLRRNEATIMKIFL